MRACLFDDAIATGKTIIEVETVRFPRVGLDPAEIEQYRDEINAMLDRLPGDFKRPDGAGFQYACFDESGEQWGEHLDMETLFALGLAAGKVRQVTDRKDWAPFPIYQVLEEPVSVETKDL